MLAWALCPVSLLSWDSSASPTVLSCPVLWVFYPQAPPSWCSGHREPLPAQHVGCVLLWGAEQLPESSLTAWHLHGKMCPQSPLCSLTLLALNSFTHLLGELSLQQRSSSTWKMSKQHPPSPQSSLALGHIRLQRMINPSATLSPLSFSGLAPTPSPQ